MAPFNLSLLLVLITFSVVSDSFPTGAPISACQTMMPGHIGVFPQPGPAPYIIKINSSSYQTGKPIQVQILGPAYRGLLLECRTFTQTTLFGQWLEPPNNTKILPCPENPVGAITHSNTNFKDQATTYIWMPTNSSCTNVLFFIATVAESFDVYWLGIRSAVIYNAQSAEVCSTSSATSQQAVVYLLMCFQIVLILVF
ncbi:putative defense protein 3 [Pseudophryne corroboree]|uniref:putative defense protein 3 n=1 Tax=Pseudophryne corroboree TaxID=495146 RepID=UPI003081AED2